MSVVPPPMSTIMLPVGSVMGSPAPTAAATGSSTRYTWLALARRVLSRTARRSTCVISAGTPMMTRGLTHDARGWAFRMKSLSMRSAASKSAMTPSRSGLIATSPWGVRPIISLASVPTASIRPCTVL